MRNSLYLIFPSFSAMEVEEFKSIKRNILSGRQVCVVFLPEKAQL
jgi:hypothetical protein